ncbi:MAG: deoxyguanosinetriphosphate triphosphohydrolase, partial [Pseudomonadota bacterium]
DLYRTRLTHSLEVAQIGRSIARAMRLNEDLTEAICLAHDLGHTPFGHAGQDALNDCMQDFGGFEHNLQSLRLVDTLERKYATFPGLNLSFETREGILKHCSRRHAESLGEVGRRFLERTQPGLEAQLANVADEIAYNNHDVDDGLRAGLLAPEQLREVTLFDECYRRALGRYPALSGRRMIHEVVRRMIGELVNDLIGTSTDRLLATNPASIDAVRAHPARLIGFSEQMQDRHQELKRFLRQHLYRHERVDAMTRQARQVVRELFTAYRRDLSNIPADYQQRAQTESPERTIADYVAGMTDRFAIKEHDRLCR